MLSSMMYRGSIRECIRMISMMMMMMMMMMMWEEKNKKSNPYNK
jgi:hypothetical protein